MQKYTLNIKEIRALSPDMVEISLEYPRENKVFKYYPGQFINLSVNIDGKEHSQSYSICSIPSTDQYLKIGIKRIQGEKVSNYLHNFLKVYDNLEVLPPTGNFYVDTAEKDSKDYYFFSAGSGITPIYTMIKSILLQESESRVYLMYGNKNQNSIAFFKELKALQKNYPNRFTLRHYISRPEFEWSDIWKSAENRFYTKGRIDSNILKSFIKKHPPVTQNVHYFICGPDDMIDSLTIALMSIDVSKSHIHFERFSSMGISKTTNTHSEGMVALLKTRLHGKSYRIELKKTDTLLAALIRHKAAPPYSCSGGTCGTCICKLKKGKVRMKFNAYLTDEEIAEGYILSCQATPLSEEIELSYSGETD